jgi:hypothetical protein
MEQPLQRPEAGLASQRFGVAWTIVSARPADDRTN